MYEYWIDFLGTCDSSSIHCSSGQMLRTHVSGNWYGMMQESGIFGRVKRPLSGFVVFVFSSYLSVINSRMPN